MQVLEFEKYVRYRTQSAMRKGAMTKEREYRDKAAETVKLAQRATSTEDKGRLLKLAESWLDLADRARRVTRRLRRPGTLHPLIVAKLDRRPGK